MLDLSCNSMHMQLLITGNAVQTSQMEVPSSPSTVNLTQKRALQNSIKGFRQPKPRVARRNSLVKP